MVRHDLLGGQKENKKQLGAEKACSGGKETRLGMRAMRRRAVEEKRRALENEQCHAPLTRTRHLGQQRCRLSWREALPARETMREGQEVPQSSPTNCTAKGLPHCITEALLIESPRNRPLIVTGMGRECLRSQNRMKITSTIAYPQQVGAAPTACFVSKTATEN